MFHNIYNLVHKKCIVEPGAHRPKGGGAAGPIRPWSTLIPVKFFLENTYHLDHSEKNLTLPVKKT